MGAGMLLNIFPILPFWLAMVVCLILLIAFPEIALFLPNTMIG